MTSAFHRTGSAAWTEDAFVARYTGQHTGFYMARILPFFAIFTAFVVLYLDDEARRLIFSRTTSTYKPFAWPEFGFLLALAAAALLDLWLTLQRVQCGAIALSISHEGITGAVFHRERLMMWDEIADVKVKGKFVTVSRKPRTLLQALIAWRGLGDINVPARQLDHPAASILAAVREFAPPGQQLPAPEIRYGVFDGPA
jgi:hypothetical protein